MVPPGAPARAGAEAVLRAGVALGAALRLGVPKLPLRAGVAEEALLRLGVP